MLLTAIRDGTLVPRPEFQRRLVWSNKHKRAFIETVLLGYPFPEIYIAAGTVDPDTGEGTELLVDGQQRLTTLQQYFTESPDLRLDDGIRPYKDLSGQEKRDFLAYEVVVRDLGERSIEEIKEIFTRINSTKYALNAMEIHNARYDGELKRFAEESAQGDFYEDHRVFQTTEIRRMGDVRFALVVLITMMSTYFNRDDDLEAYLQKYNDEFPLRDELQTRLDHVFTFIDSCKLAERSRAWKKADLLTLIVELDRLMNKEQVNLRPSPVARALRDFYSKVDSAAKSGRPSRSVADYYRATIQANNDRSSRITRGEILRRQLVTSPALKSKAPAKHKP